MSHTRLIKEADAAFRSPWEKQHSKGKQKVKPIKRMFSCKQRWRGGFQDNESGITGRRDWTGTESSFMFVERSWSSSVSEKRNVWFQIPFHFKEPLLCLPLGIITLKCLSGSFYPSLFVFFCFWYFIHSCSFLIWSILVLILYSVWCYTENVQTLFIQTGRKKKPEAFSLLLLLFERRETSEASWS